MSIERTTRVSLLPRLRTVRGIPDAVANYKMTALPHFYSLGHYEGTKFMFAASAAWLGNLLCLAAGIGLYAIAKFAGIRQEKASVNALAGLIKTDADKTQVLQEMGNALSLLPRLTLLLEKRGVVI